MLFKEDASYYAEAIKAGDLKPSELVEWALENIETYNESINAIIHVQTDQARQLAKSYDEKLASLSPTERQTLPVFYGVPILLKDAGHNQKGQPATNGAKFLKDQIADESTNFVEDILGAGFIVVGRTNIPEFAFKGISDSLLYGPVSMPQDLERQAGGSSGGAAAAVKAGIVPIATASDGGGSIRIPASYTGLIGLKPSRGRIRLGRGRYRGWQGAAVDFAVTRSVRDTWALLKELQVYQIESPFPLKEIEAEHLETLARPLNIAYFDESPMPAGMSEEAKEMIAETVSRLEALGHKVTKTFPDFDIVKAGETYYNVNAGETSAVFLNLEEALGRSIEKDEVEPLTWAMKVAGENLGAGEYSRTLAFWDQTAAKVEDFFREYDLILLPTATNVAPKHGTTVDIQDQHEDYFSAIEEIPYADQIKLIADAFEPGSNLTPYTIFANITGTTAISLPVYETEDKLPIGVQLWTGKGREYTLLQVAEQFERAGYLKTDIYEVKA